MGESNRDERARGTLQRGGKNVPLPKSGESKHETWTATTNHDVEVVGESAEDSRTVARVLDERDVDLIAAAPLMLEALRAVRDSGWLDKPECGRLPETVRDAIKAATGGET